MTYLTIFLVVWLALILFSRLVMRWPKEANEIYERYAKGLILKGFLSPRFLQTKFSDDHVIAVLFLVVFWLLTRYLTSYADASTIATLTIALVVVGEIYLLLTVYCTVRKVMHGPGFREIEHHLELEEEQRNNK